MTTCILALADDMTGALEVGAQFSGAGIATIVSAEPVPVGAAPVVVLDTETRHAAPASARQTIIRFIAESGPRQPQLIYKKTDSTLRGNIRAELQALGDLYPDWTIGYAPAYPALGRTVKGGTLYVHGRAVAETEFALDQLNPIGTSSVTALLDSQPGCTVFDGDTDQHLREAAHSILSQAQMRIAAGPSGLAGMLANLIDLPRRERLPYPQVRTCLALNGSRHEHSARQIRIVTAPGWRVLRQSHEAGSQASEVAIANAKYLLRHTALQAPDALLVLGGDTAFALVRELGFPPLMPLSEVVPGVPVTQIAAASLQTAFPGRTRDLILITKAGEFGDDDILSRVRAKLSDDDAK